MEISISSTKELKRLAEQLAKGAFPGDIYALYGELGAGKTTFTRYFVEALGFDVRVQSPTFVIVRRYIKGQDSVKLYDRRLANGEDAKRGAQSVHPQEIKKVYHVDLYRLTSKNEVDDIGLKEMFVEDGAITIIEWPEIYESELPQDTIKIKFEYLFESENSEERKVSIENAQDL